MELREANNVCYDVFPNEDGTFLAINRETLACINLNESGLIILRNFQKDAIDVTVANVVKETGLSEDKVRIPTIRFVESLNHSGFFGSKTKIKFPEQVKKGLHVLIDESPNAIGKVTSVVEEAIRLAYSSIYLVGDNLLQRNDIRSLISLISGCELSCILKTTEDLAGNSCDFVTENVEQIIVNGNELMSVYGDVEAISGVLQPYRNLPMVVEIVADSETLPYLKDFEALCNQMGFGYGIKPLIVKDMNVEALTQPIDFVYKRQKEESFDLHFVVFRKSCGVCSGELAFGNDGFVYPCLGFAHDEEFRLGKTLAEAECNSKFRELADITVDDVESCKNCVVRYICGGGCRASAFYSQKSFLAHEASACTLNRSRSLLLLYNASLLPIDVKST